MIPHSVAQAAPIPNFAFGVVPPKVIAQSLPEMPRPAPSTIPPQHDRMDVYASPLASNLVPGTTEPHTTVVSPLQAWRGAANQLIGRFRRAG